MEKFIDTHAHYGHKKFNKPTSDLLQDVFKNVEIVIQIGTNTKSNKHVINMVDQFDKVYGMVGFFPVDVWELEKNVNSNADEIWNSFINQLNHNKILGIGEIGLDYSWNRVGNCLFGDEAKKIQKKWFVNQLDLARAKKLPVSIHSRDAELDTLDVFQNYDSLSGVIHCFSYGRSAAFKAIDKGLYLGIGGTSTYPNNDELRDVIKAIPLDRLLLETDAPYLSPQQVRREINTSLNIKYVIENIANIKNISCDDVINQTNKNAYDLFKRLK